MSVSHLTTLFNKIKSGLNWGCMLRTSCKAYRFKLPFHHSSKYLMLRYSQPTLDFYKALRDTTCNFILVSAKPSLEVHSMSTEWWSLKQVYCIDASQVCASITLQFQILQGILHMIYLLVHRYCTFCLFCWFHSSRTMH